MKHQYCTRYITRHVRTRSLLFLCRYFVSKAHISCLQQRSRYPYPSFLEFLCSPERHTRRFKFPAVPRLLPCNARRPAADAAALAGVVVAVAGGGGLGIVRCLHHGVSTSTYSSTAAAAVVDALEH